MPTSHSVDELRELLIVGLEFLDLGLVKIEADHPVIGVDRLLTRLEEQRPSNWDVPTSLDPIYRGDWGSCYTVLPQWI